MKKSVIIAALAVSLVAGSIVPAFASDWDKAGKVLAVFEGLRVLTGGRADVIGTVTGINRPQDRGQESCERDQPRDRHSRGRHYAFGHTRHVCERVWVPEYVWVEKYVPRHTEYRPGCGKVVIEGHYERYQVEQGGSWQAAYGCRD